MAENREVQSSDYAPWPNAAAQRLNKLAGRWSVEAYLPDNPPKIVGGLVSFDWISEGYFLREQSQLANPDFPQSLAIIGCDGSLQSYSMLYYDSRGVSRLYHMSLTDDLWKLWRDEPGFMQRFTGHFNDNGNTIKAYWEQSDDGSEWALDFDIVYTRLAA